MTETTHAAEEGILINQAEIEKAKPEYGLSQVCFGAVMAIAALYGIWGAVSILISYFAA